MIRKVENREAHPSAADWYWAVEHEGVRLLLTDREYEAARRRAAKNPEDFEIEAPEPEPPVEPEPEPEPDPPVVPEPEPPASGALITEGFDYPDFARFRSQPYATEIVDGGGAISIDAGRLRYDWRAASSPSRGGTISVGIKVPDTPELWLELHAALSPGFSIDNGYSGGAALKFFGLRYRNPPAGRIGVGFEGSQLTFAGPDDALDASHVRTGLRLDDLADGQMHRYRLHVRLSGAQAVELWVDGRHFPSRTGWRSAAARIYGVWLGKNINQAPLRSQWQLWDNVRIWTQDPGW